VRLVGEGWSVPVTSPCSRGRVRLAEGGRSQHWRAVQLEVADRIVSRRKSVRKLCFVVTAPIGPPETARMHTNEHKRRVRVRFLRRRVISHGARRRTPTMSHDWSRSGRRRHKTYRPSWGWKAILCSAVL